jgi:hypothetical protein
MKGLSVVIAGTDKIDRPTTTPAVSSSSRLHRSRWARAVVGLPDRVVIGFLALSVVIALALLVEWFTLAVVLPAGLAAIVLTRRWTPRRPEVDRRSLIGSASAVVLAAAWYLVNRPMTGEPMGIQRDPALYALSGLYLIDHPTADVLIPADTVSLARNVSGVQTDWTGGDPEGRLPVQGASLVPGFIGLAGRLLGPVEGLRVVVLIAALALIGVYAIARRLLGPLWGLLPVFGLALSMPLAAFGRSPYSEPATLLFVSGALLCLWAAIDTRSLRFFTLAGVYAGASMIPRVDGGLVVLGGLAGAGAIGVLAGTRAGRSFGRKALCCFAAGAAPMILLGWGDLWIHSPRYLQDQAPQVIPMLIAMPVVLVGLLVLSWVRPLSLGPAAFLARHRRRVAPVAAVLTGLAIAAMVSRPLWFVSRRMGVFGENYVDAVAGRQRSEGLAVDGHRSYDEMTINWLAWYFGWAVVVAACVGTVIAVHRAVRDRNPTVLVVGAIPLAAAALYLNQVSITPDQIWAIRRLLPVVIPATTILAAFTFRELARWLGRRSRRRVLWRRLTVAVATASFAFPVVTWGSLFTVAENAGQQAATAQICAAVPEDRVVLAGRNPSFGYFLPTLQQACGLDAVAVADATTSRMSQVEAGWIGGDPIAVVVFDPSEVTWTGGRVPAPTATVTYRQWESNLSRRPANAGTFSDRAWVGILQPDGTVAAPTG